MIMNTTTVTDKISECDGWRNKLLGKVVLEDNEKSILDADECVRRKELPSPNRVLPPNAVMTADFCPDRLNIMVDHTMRVTDVQYG